MQKPKLAVHKFTSCDGCQLAFLNAGEALLELANQVDIVHFPEAGPVNPNAKADITFVEGSISTPQEEKRIKQIRENSKYLITIGACATTGGIQALRNFETADKWVASIYASPEHIHTLATSTAIANHVKVDFELWGCPVNTKQVMTAIRSLLSGVAPVASSESVCIDCKNKNKVCVVVAKGEPCLGPVTKTGCGVLCPSVGRGCYGCYGPSENPNTESLAKWFKQFGLGDEQLARYFLHINNQAPAFLRQGTKLKGIRIKVVKD